MIIKFYAFFGFIFFVEQRLNENKWHLSESTHFCLLHLIFNCKIKIVSNRVLNLLEVRCGFSGSFARTNDTFSSFVVRVLWTHLLIMMSLILLQSFLLFLSLLIRTIRTIVRFVLFIRKK